MRRLLYIFVLLVLCSCTKTIYQDVPIEVEKIHTQYIHDTQKDSVYVKDSIYIHEKSDTVFVNRFKTKYIERLKIDTVLKTDTIPKIVKVKETIVEHQNPLEKMFMWIGALLVLAIILCITIKITRR